MSRHRPLSVTIVALVFIVTGCSSLVRSILPFVQPAAAAHGVSLSKEIADAVIVAASGLLALLGGIYVLCGRHWARWVCVIWMGLHVIVGLLHTLEAAVIHAVFLVVLIWLLWRQRATSFFRNASV